MKIKLIIGMAVLFGITTASGAAGKKEDRKHQENRRFKQLIERFDKDKDGKLNAEERKALVKAMKARKGDKKPKGKKPANKK